MSGQMSHYTKISLLIVRFIAGGLILWSTNLVTQFFITVIQMEGHLGVMILLFALICSLIPFFMGYALERNSLTLARKLAKDIDG